MCSSEGTGSIAGSMAGYETYNEGFRVSFLQFCFFSASLSGTYVGCGRHISFRKPARMSLLGLTRQPRRNLTSQLIEIQLVEYRRLDYYAVARSVAAEKGRRKLGADHVLHPPLPTGPNGS
jgi:hypothetical protein